VASARFTEHVSLYVEPDVAKYIEAASRMECVSKSDVVRDLIARGIVEKHPEARVVES
jgi:hypothetical protein